ncbi:bifunctional metallophosphatase/5'-nucleotidase [Halosimplex halophilum]|uniref:bifunctional metallophosphatase/5'-nucleotidase n=1 Tax=Halosimplex halophilum TaxID=2559572 RepID=UPI00107FA935|nr:bifunctional metallophosphatase/5'-nucleotidase [Halosimplex halophilum]
MAPRLLHYSDLENAFDRPERVGRLAGTIESVRGPGTLVVGTGDQLAPGALAIEERGRQTLPFYDRVAPDAETFGNHDFDHSPADTREVVAESGVDWLGANVRVDGEPFAGVDAAKAVERGGARVALVGVSGPDLAVPRSVRVTDPVAAVREAVDGLDAAPDRVVVLAHAGDAVARDLCRETRADAVLAGHVHSETRERVAGTLLVRPGANGRVLWEVELPGDRAEPATATHHEAPSGPLDEGTAAAVRERLADHGLDEVVARLDRPVPRERARCLRGECALANLATDALRWVADADAAHVDTRGLRDGPPVGPDVTVADLRGIAPFQAGVFVATVSGAQLRSLVAESVRRDGVDGRDGEVWTGQFAGVEIRRDRAAGETEVSFDGSPLTDDRELRLAVNGYVVYADEFATVGPADARELHGLQYRAFEAYAREADDLSVGTDGRIEYADG